MNKNFSLKILALVCVLILLLSFLRFPSKQTILNPKLTSSYELALSWFIGSINQRGSFNYLYDPQLDLYLDANNEIRQLMASRLLAELANEDSQYLSKHQKNLSYIFKRFLKYQDNYAYIDYEGKSKIGANAMALRLLVASPLFPEYYDLAEKLKLAIIKTINQDGSMEPFLIKPSYQYDHDYLLTFYTGEALLALIEYYQIKKDPQLLELIINSQDFYITRYVKNLADNYYPAYVPWHTMSLNKLFQITQDKKYAEAIFILNDRLLAMQDLSVHRGRFFNPETPQFGMPHASSDGVYTEGLLYAYEVAMQVGDSFRQKIYQESINNAFSHLMSLQYTHLNTQQLPNPQRIIGAFRISRSNPDAPFDERPGSNTRIDCGQHILDAFRKYQHMKLEFN